MKKIDKVRKRIFAVEILRLLKKDYSYSELSTMFHLPIPVLSRYVNGQVLPGLKRSAEIINFFKREKLIHIIKSKTVYRENLVDDSKILCDVNLLDKIAKLIAHEFNSMSFDKVMTKETDGIPLAVQVGSILDLEVLIVKGRKDIAINSFIEERINYPSGVYSYIYLPKGLLRKGERVLLVDDIIRTGSTIEGLAKLCWKSMAEVKGVYVIFSLGNSLRKLRGKLKCPVKSLIHIGERDIR